MYCLDNAAQQLWTEVS
ncbi:hypothetical protein Nmel_010032 [Mimus melanotis]